MPVPDPNAKPPTVTITAAHSTVNPVPIQPKPVAPKPKPPVESSESKETLSSSPVTPVIYTDRTGTEYRGTLQGNQLTLSGSGKVLIGIQQGDIGAKHSWREGS